MNCWKIRSRVFNDCTMRVTSNVDRNATPQMAIVQDKFINCKKNGLEFYIYIDEFCGQVEAEPLRGRETPFFAFP
jgi:hypothetical protein